MDARDLATIFRLALAELRDEVIYGTAEDPLATGSRKLRAIRRPS
ncbi:MAG: hypothetical protein U0841_00645 [Chloroflexia bacterium]